MTDASRDVRDGDRDSVADDDAADAGRPSLADWLVVSVRPSQMPPADPSVAEELPPSSRESEPPGESGRETEHEPAPPLAATPAPGDETASLGANESDSNAVAADEDTLPRDFSGVDAAADAEADASEMDAASSLTPQIFSPTEPELDPDPDSDLHEALGAVLLSPAARARRRAVPRGAFFLLGAALVLFFLGRWFVRRHASAPETVASAAVPAPMPAPSPAASAPPAEPEESIVEEEPIEPEQSLPSGVESTGRTRRSSQRGDQPSAAPLVAPAWSVARFPDLPRDVLIACEQAAEKAHSATPASPAVPPSP